MTAMTNVLAKKKQLFSKQNEYAIEFFFQFATFETVVSGFVDTFPEVLRKHKTLFTAFMCLLTLILGIPMVSRV